MKPTENTKPGSSWYSRLASLFGGKMALRIVSGFSVQRKLFFEEIKFDSGIIEKKDSCKQYPP